MGLVLALLASFVLGWIMCRIGFLNRAEQAIKQVDKNDDAERATARAIRMIIYNQPDHHPSMTEE